MGSHRTGNGGEDIGSCGGSTFLYVQAFGTPFLNARKLADSDQEAFAAEFQAANTTPTNVNRTTDDSTTQQTGQQQ